MQAAARVAHGDRVSVLNLAIWSFFLQPWNAIAAQNLASSFASCQIDRVAPEPFIQCDGRNRLTMVATRKKAKQIPKIAVWARRSR